MNKNNTISLKFIKYVVIIVAAVTIGIFLGKFITNYETRYLLNREYCGKYRGIEVYKSGTINADNFIGHAHLLEAAPDVLVECCDVMYFTGDDLNVPSVGGSFGKALGLTQDGTIYISTSSFNIDVIYHELFHAYDNKHDKISESFEFLRIVDKERDKVFVELHDEDMYAAEFFAAAGAQYLLEPEILKNAAPETYDFIDKLINEDLTN